ncbi:DUF1847 domain-containing protein [Desulforamulus aeronauticus]|uniref:Uncharacterized metal-binding protein n=1 Tax=Desulforamulus aeronauticus DSM 10349 TaxID=1121421 RepID=A0A1M6VVF2_9FIRM|nr:DUF1847 domain-containing protein [Desulforamulus aeronauticus]SHK85437.1 Uncharacterized metal-binding protein [Desulforamulus aeronauticus DSM 10349]
MKCASCKLQPKNKCDKEGFDCTGGKYALDEYDEDVNKDYHRLSGHFQAVHGNNLTRLDEVILLAKRMGYQRIGLAFCVGLTEEAAILEEILSKHFEVYSACCKIGGLKKEDYDVPKVKEDKVEILCDPILQAKVLNQKKTDLNLEIGLCVGHDMLFAKYSEAPVTTFAVKDRVLGHNPLAICYSSYLRKKFKNKKYE